MLIYKVIHLLNGARFTSATSLGVYGAYLGGLIVTDFVTLDMLNRRLSFPAYITL